MVGFGPLRQDEFEASTGSDRDSEAWKREIRWNRGWFRAGIFQALDSMGTGLWFLGDT